MCLSLLLFLPCVKKLVGTQTCLPKDSRDKFLNCSTCLIEAGAGCGWCFEEDKDNQNLAKGCVPTSQCLSSRFSYGNMTEDLQKNANLTDYISIKPQQINLKLRPKMKHILYFTAKSSVNPVDIYFLLDLTGSMKQFKKQLETIPEKLVKDIKARTNDYQFGYGGFTEKPMTPWRRIIPGVEYDFEHFQKLTNETDKLKEKIKKSELLVGNYDTPEAGMDGLMQVLLCNDEIGWRKLSTHIIVFITDAPSHIAGDGILGGIWKPYEHKCNLVKDKQSKDPEKLIYNSLDNDYPSLSEINYLLDKTQKTVIFGTPSNILPLYKQMVTEEVIYRAAAGDIGLDGEGLRELVVEEYNRIEGRVQISAINFQPSKLASQVVINFNSSCSEKDEQINENEIICNGVNSNNKIQFTATIELDPTVCEFKTPLSFEIQVFGPSNSAMKVELNPVCECEDCGDDRNPINPCNQNGDPQAKLVCGSCQCVNNQGDTCQCSKESGVKLDELIERCQTGPGNEECSGQGSCHCGICKCFPGFFGKYCGCEKGNTNCGDAEGRGVPQCKQKKSERTGQKSCKCHEGWKGETCNCSSKTDQCEDPITNKACNDNGTCNCNQCQCDYNEGYYCQRQKDFRKD